MAETEKEALSRMFKPIRDAIKHHGVIAPYWLATMLTLILGLIRRSDGRDKARPSPISVLIPRHLVGWYMVKLRSQSLRWLV